MTIEERIKREFGNYVVAILQLQNEVEALTVERDRLLKAVDTPAEPVKED